LQFYGKVNLASIFCLGIEKQNTVGNVRKLPMIADVVVVVHITDSMAAGQSYCISRQQETTVICSLALSLSLSSSDFKVPQLGNVVVSLCGASGNTPYRVLLLVYVGRRATHFTGYCCLVYVGLGQHTLLGIVVGLCGALGNTHYWV
jgi:hypothetical protein